MVRRAGIPSSIQIIAGVAAGLVQTVIPVVTASVCPMVRSPAVKPAACRGIPASPTPLVARQGILSVAVPVVRQIIVVATAPVARKVKPAIMTVVSIQ